MSADIARQWGRAAFCPKSKGSSWHGRAPGWRAVPLPPRCAGGQAPVGVLGYLCRFLPQTREGEAGPGLPPMLLLLPLLPWRLSLGSPLSDSPTRTGESDQRQAKPCLSPSGPGKVSPASTPVSQSAVCFEESQWPQGSWPGLAFQTVRNKGRDLAQGPTPTSPRRAAGVFSAAQMEVQLSRQF